MKSSSKDEAARDALAKILTYVKYYVNRKPARNIKGALIYRQAPREPTHRVLKRSELV